MPENLYFMNICNELVKKGYYRSLSELARLNGKSSQYFTDFKKGKTNYSRELYDCILDKHQINKEYIKNGEPPILIGELTPKEFSSHIEVRLVSTKARAGFSESYYSDEYLEDMPVVLIEADKEYKGKYIAFEVDGDSMEPEYHKGDVVICREVRRDLWRSKLHINDWDFVIAHSTKGIMLKQIIDHNVETGEIVCHSLNFEDHPDFTLNLHEVAFLYNVVEHRISGKNKRRYR